MITCDFFTKRSPQTQERLAKIRCPVRLVHCGADIAYSVDHTFSFRDSLLAAGLSQVSVAEVPDACHFGTVTHSREYVLPLFLLGQI